MGDFQIRRITLPSGRVVELVYFADAVDAPAETAPLGGIDQRLETCPVCLDEHVCPVTWEEVADARWRVELRCPDCEWRGSNIFDQETVDRYDDVLCAATDAIIAQLERITRENMEADVERFVAALQGDLILPEDF